MKTKKRSTVKQSNSETPIGLNVYRLTRHELTPIGYELGWFDNPDYPEDMHGEDNFFASDDLEHEEIQKQLIDFVKPHAARITGLDPDRFDLHFWRVERGDYYKFVGSIEFQIVLKP